MRRNEISLILRDTEEGTVVFDIEAKNPLSSDKTEATKAEIAASELVGVLVVLGLIRR